MDQLDQSSAFAHLSPCMFMCMHSLDASAGHWHASVCSSWPLALVIPVDVSRMCVAVQAAVREVARTLGQSLVADLGVSPLPLAKVALSILHCVAESKFGLEVHLHVWRCHA